MPLMLASKSPRRAKILSQLGIDYEVVVTDAAEVSYQNEPEKTVLENALSKLSSCVKSPALAADTIVWFDGKIYGKPVDDEEAKVFLRELSGNTHTVFTGVAYRDENGVVKTSCEKSNVTFKKLTDEVIDSYVAQMHPTDRAGAYDIDELGGMIVDSYEGEYENIMGLPILPLVKWAIASPCGK